jgi:hypothetical protein
MHGMRYREYTRESTAKSGEGEDVDEESSYPISSSSLLHATYAHSQRL